MIKRETTSIWEGNLKEGQGQMHLQSGAYQGPYTFSSRFEQGKGTNPEELVGAAHSGCFSMFLSALISKKELKPKRIQTRATVTLETLDDGPKITGIHLECEAEVSGLTEDDFQALVQEAKIKCPISRLYQGTDITIQAKLKAY